MLKRNITYKNIIDDTEITDAFYFNLTAREIVMMELEHEGGLQGAIERMVNSNDMKSIMQEMEKVVLTAYGVRSENGKRFIKNDEIRTEFIEIGAYDALFMELVTNDEAAANFIRAVIPADMPREVETTQPIPFPPVPPNVS